MIFPLWQNFKVPSFPDDIAMAFIEEELGSPWPEIYDELSPSPIAAGIHHFYWLFERTFYLKNTGN